MWRELVEMIHDCLFCHAYGPDALELRKAQRAVAEHRVDRVCKPGRWRVWRSNGEVVTERLDRGGT